MRVRGCVMISAPAPAETYRRWMGCSMTAPRRMRKYAPSSHKRRVQRGKHIAAHVGIAAQMLLDAFGSATFGRRADHAAVDRAQQRTDFQTLGQVAKIGEARREVPVHEDKLAGRARNAERLDLLRRNRNAALHRALKRSLRQRREIGEPPVLVVRGGKSLVAEARPCVLAQLPQPHRVALLPLCEQFAIRFEIFSRLSGRRRHCFLASAFSLRFRCVIMQTKPRAHRLPPSRIPCLPAPAPAPARPSARSFHPPARARSP